MSNTENVSKEEVTNKTNNKKFSVGRFLENNMVIIVLIILAIGFNFGSSTFKTPKNLINLTSQMSINALLAAGMTYVIILAGIDISVGSVAGFAGVVAAIIGLNFPEMGIPFAVVLLIVTGIVVGGLCGLFNGLMITKFKVVPMIATLAMLSVARGMAYVITNGQPVYGLPDSFSWLGAGRMIQTEGFPNGLIPVITVFTVVVVAFMHILLSKTVFGRHVYASGSNDNVAHLSGINVDKVKLISYALCGCMAGLAGVCIASKLQNGQPGAADTYEMYAIAATVLGGTSFEGGKGSVGKAMFGAAIIAVINNGMNLMHLQSFWQKVVIGTIILLAVILDQNQKARAKKSK